MQEFVSRLRRLGVRLWLDEQQQLRYRAPKGVLTPALVAELHTHQAALIAFLQAQAPSAVAPAPPLVPVPRSEPLPLSFAQERLWLLDQLTPGSPRYNIPLTVRIRGPLQHAALQQAMDLLVQRHEVLRTTIAVHHGRPTARIAPMLPFTLPVVNLSAHPPATRHSQAADQARHAAQQPFDLQHGPLMRALLLRLAPDEHWLLLTLHHLVVDGWSLAILADELTQLYAAYVTGGLEAAQRSLAPLPVQYADYAVWQRAWLQGERLTRQLHYWRQQLQPLPERLALPTDDQPAVEDTLAGATLDLTLNAALTGALETLSRQAGVALFMTLLAGFQALLYRYTGQDDIAVGTPIAGRAHVATEGMIGCFINMLVLRTDLSGNPSMHDLLERVRTVTLAAYAHQDLPFERLVAELHPDRTTDTPLVQVLFALQNTPAPQQRVDGVRFEPLPVDSGAARFDMSVTVVPEATGLQVHLEYKTARFTAATMQQLLRHYERLLQGMVADPGWRVRDLPLLSTLERDELLHRWNPPQTPLVAPTLCALIAAQVTRTPDAIAVADSTTQLTYSELQARASQLAHTLRAQGVRSGTIVGIGGEPSVALAVGLLGILLAGAAYLPLDPHLPPDRLAFMLRDAQVELVLYQGPLRDRLPATNLRTIALDHAWESIAVDPAEVAAWAPSRDQLAYVIYTSGSTGQPKGVLIPHYALVNILSSMQQVPGLTAQDTLLAITTIAFDIAGLELWWPLSVGARVVFVERALAADPQQLATRLAEVGATVLQATPVTWRMLIEHGWAGRPGLQALCGGEALASQLAQALLPRVGSLWNLYGPTETTIWSTQERVTVDAGAVSIGRPIANTQIYLLDQNMEPVPLGVAGEIYIGGAGLAWGYLNRPTLTAERFVPDPFSSEPGTRLYKTGDRARYRADGRLDYLGRQDYQVKLRGYRIELGEIEHALRQHPQVREAVVVAREDTGHTRLVAYVVEQRTQPGSESQDAVHPLGAELRKDLRERLPVYMIPAAFVFLDALPLTPNRKIDRRALPAPDWQQPQPVDAYVAPRTPLEEQLVHIWSQILGLERIGTDDNFFSLGGDSLLSMQVVDQVRQAGYHLTPQQVLQHQTIAGLALVLEKAPVSGAVENNDHVAAGATVPLMSLQHWYFEWQPYDLNHWNTATYLESEQPLDPGIMEQVVRHILIQHPALQLRFVREEAGWRQFLGESNGPLPFHRFDLSTLVEAEQDRALEEAIHSLHTSLDITHGPLIRVALFDLGAQRPSRLLIIIHHLVVDITSWRILQEDFQTAYGQLARGEQIQLPPKTTSFRQWSERLNEYAQSAALREELDYWRNLPWDQVVGIPRDNPEAINIEEAIQTVSVSSSGAEIQSLVWEILKIENLQIVDVVWTALAQGFTRWAETPYVLVETLGHGRVELFDDIDLLRTVGWLATHTPVLLEMTDDGSADESLRSVQAQLRRIPRQGIGYGVLRYLCDDPDVRAQLSALPQPEIFFHYQGRTRRDGTQPSVFRQATGSPGARTNGKNIRLHLMACMIGIVDETLELKIEYCENVYRRATVERLSEMIMSALRALINGLREVSLQSITSTQPRSAIIDQGYAELKSGRMAAQTPTQQILIGIWQEILGVAHIGIDDHFVDLGGHSLLATQITSRVYDAFQIDLPVRSIFESSTIAALAQEIDSMVWAAKHLEAPAITVEGTREEGSL